MAALKGLQARLGELNDIDVACSVVGRVAPDLPGDAAFAAGREVGRMAAREDRLLEEADRALKAFRATRAFWKAPPA